MAVTPTPCAAGTVVSASCMYRGYSLRETAGAAAAIRIWAGKNKDGTLLDAVGLPANGTANAIYSFEEGENAQGGIFIELVAGTIPNGVIKHSTV